VKKLILILGGIVMMAFLAGCDTEGSNSNSNSNDDNGGGDYNAGKIWTYYYYADPSPLNRVVVMDPASMTEVASIWVPGLSPHSADRAGFTDKMYIRTAGVQSFDVINARTQSYEKTVALPHKPRAAGAYNKYLNLQLISGKDHPMVSVIDVATDTVVGTVGPYVQPGQSISGNCGGNATGHSNWLDANHFTLLDRYNDEITVYKITPNGAGGYDIVETQKLPMLTGVHTLDVDVPDKSLTKRVFYAAVEGSVKKNVAPHIMEMTYDGNGHLIPGRVVQFPGIGSSEMIHHYGIAPDGKIWMPMCLSKKLFVIDTNTMQVVQTYNIGLGGGHVNFSAPLSLAIVTNHFDHAVTIINMVTGEEWPVKITDAHEEVNLFIQSHLNWVSPDGKFFYIFATHDGVFVEIDLTTKSISRTYYTGGTPEQSTS
jgi:hypothetical protein